MRKSASGSARARNGATARSPAAGSPAYVINPKMTSLPWCSSGTNGIGGQGMTLAMVDSSSGAASAAAMNPATVSAVAGRISIPPTISGDLVEPVLEARRDAEVAAAAADRPEQVRMVLGVDQQAAAPSAVTTSAASSVVDRQSELAHEVADAAAERDAADPDRAGVAEPDRQPVRSDVPSVTSAAVSPVSAHAVRPSTSMSRPLMSDRSRTIAALGDAVAGAAVAAAADGELQSRLAREAHDVGHVVDVGDLDDDGRSAVDRTGRPPSGLGRSRRRRRDDLALEIGAQLRDGEGRGAVWFVVIGQPPRRGRRRPVESRPDGAPNMVGSVRREMRLEAVPGLGQALLHPDPNREVEVLGGREAGDAGERRAGVGLVEGDGDHHLRGIGDRLPRRRR